MRKSVFFITAAAVVCFVNPSFAAPAVQIKDIGCFFFDADGGFSFFSDTKNLGTSNKNGNSMAKCWADGVPNSQGKAAVYDSNNNPFGPGISCSFYDPAAGVTRSTKKWQETISASGHAEVSCHYPG
jgi:hypothetical protein